MLLLKLAFRNIFRQKRRSILTGLTMTGGYILCAFSISLVEGSYSNIIEYFTRDHTGHIQIHMSDYLHRPQIYKNIADYASISELLDKQDSIQSFAPRVMSPALAYGHNKNTPVQVIGVDILKESSTSRLREKVREGKYLSSIAEGEEHYPALVGRAIADQLKLDINDELILISQGADGSIANDIFKVSGVVGTISSQDKLKVYLPLKAAQEFFSLENRVNEIAILLADPGDAREVASEIQLLLSKRPVSKGQNESNRLEVSPWQVVEDVFYLTMQSDKRGNRFTLGIIIFIVFIGVLNTVLMSVLERTREFGVLKAIGTRPQGLMTMIIFETILLALMSCLFGFLVSLPIVLWFTVEGFSLTQPIDIGGIAFSHLRGEFSLAVYLYPLLIICFSTLLVSIPPGIRAARISPLKALMSH